MLPKEILNKANLAQNKESETISALIEFNDDGSINKYEIFEAIIKPKYQLTYEDANEILEIEPKEEDETEQFRSNTIAGNKMKAKNPRKFHYINQ